MGKQHTCTKTKPTKICTNERSTTLNHENLFPQKFNPQNITSIKFSVLKVLFVYVNDPTNQFHL